MSGKYEVGAVVKLKSGGPPMTVTGYSDPGKAICQWFEKGSDTAKKDVFPDAALEPSEPRGVKF